MANALIGYSGFVGTTLRKQTEFGAQYRANNIHEIEHQQFDTLVCAGAPAKKWLANKHPDDDKQTIERLIKHLKTVRCRQFVLISTVDVFSSPIAVDETSLIDEQKLSAYGRHRRKLEQFVEAHFPSSLIIRLPGLVGPGLTKNVLFDFLNDNQLDRIEARNIYQFYPMVNLWYDIKKALSYKLKILHLNAAPLSVSECAELGFGFNFNQHLAGNIIQYDLHSCHTELFGKQGPYFYTKDESLQAIRHYAQTEQLTLQRTAEVMV